MIDYHQMRNKGLLIFVIILLIATSCFAATKATTKKSAPKPKVTKVKAKPAPAVPVEWAANVNGDIITMDLYNKRLEAATKQMKKEISVEAGVESEESDEVKTLRKSILEQMIEAVVLMQWAEREGISIMDKTIKSRVQDLKKGFPTPKEFHKSLAEQGMTVADLENNIKKQIITDKLINMREKALAVTDEEIRSFYDKNLDLYVQKGKLHLSQIFFKDKTEAESEKSKLSARKAFSGEDIGLVEQGQLPINDDSQVLSLQPGEISDIISGESGYYIFKAEERLPGRETKFEDVKDSIRKFLLKEKARTQYLKDLLDEKKNAKIIINEKLDILF
jgi:parvulin-like peptidyl-prolyl isomerase